MNGGRLTYTTAGPVRGIGPRRQTLAAARADLLADREGCAAQGGYSDREVYEVRDDGRGIVGRFSAAPAGAGDTLGGWSRLACVSDSWRDAVARAAGCQGIG